MLGGTCTANGRYTKSLSWPGQSELNGLNDHRLPQPQHSPMLKYGAELAAEIGAAVAGEAYKAPPSMPAAAATETQIERLGLPVPSALTEIDLELIEMSFLLFCFERPTLLGTTAARLQLLQLAL
jgi:hypothetical protein